ncbi:hypothetical protein V2J09_017855, partial [Rumex salicifolius]
FTPVLLSFLDSKPPNLIFSFYGLTCTRSGAVACLSAIEDLRHGAYPLDLHNRGSKLHFTCEIQPDLDVTGIKFVDPVRELRSDIKLHLRYCNASVSSKVCFSMNNASCFMELIEEMCVYYFSSVMSLLFLLLFFCLTL